MTEETQILNFQNVLAHGVDVVDTAEFARLINRQASEFLDRYFTATELFSAGVGGDRVEKLASRFAVKEAVLKALGTGWGDGIAFTDVEVVSQWSGAPSIVLHRRLAAIASERGVVHWLVSASHTSGISIASVIALTSSIQN
ncbi:holo-[acyl-carrier-protein] synthase [Comamonas sp. Z1]|uniref:holo-ACP synthase n=1 Tax=Comamonas sp. Z1 TaxID=2601246 RepID=UPI0011E6D0A6|nr:holo-ACP synthase [Comamonas sp. Z1]TYK72024.1 holo-[acyl-carrier-protein] synthase [Comamonas sp. Z1]